VSEEGSGSGRCAGRPRILQVLYSFRMGGSEVFGVQLARQLLERGAEVVCGALDSSPGPLLERCAQYGIRTIDLAVPAVNPLGRNGLSWRLMRKLRELRPDAVHLQHFLGLNKLGIPARLAGIHRIVVTEHSVLDVARSWTGKTRARLSWRLASDITVVHQSIKDYLCGELGIPQERVHVIPIGIEIEDYGRNQRAAMRVRLGLGSEIVFVFVGRLAPVKNVGGLLSAFLAVQERSATPARLIIVGDGEERGACEELLRSHPLGERVTLVGEQADPRPYLAAADVFVLNSRSEGTPRALLEAMAMGLPAISPAVGGVCDLLAGRGWLTAPGSPAALENALQAVLENPDSIAASGARCREYVCANFDSRRIVGQYQSLLLGSHALHPAQC
jgi:glycosyltransferase involved in cell wall biosynthesis